MLPSGRIQQRPLEFGDLDPRLDHFRFVGNEHQIEFGGFRDQPGLFGEGLLVPVDVLQGDQLRTQVEPHPFILKGVPDIEFGFEFGFRQIGCHHGADSRFIVKGLFMPVKDGFTADGKRADPLSHCNRPNRWSRRFGQLLAGLCGYIRAAVQFGLAGCQIHGKCQAGGDAAFLTVGFRQEFEYLDSG
jgi:hypothetical protein